MTTIGKINTDGIFADRTALELIQTPADVTLATDTTNGTKSYLIGIQATPAVDPAVNAEYTVTSQAPNHVTGKSPLYLYSRTPDGDTSPRDGLGLQIVIATKHAGE